MNTTDLTTASSVSEPLGRYIEQRIVQRGGWLPFDEFMQAALYAPGLGYYANALPKLGGMPASGSDFITAPDLSPLFGQCIAQQLAQVLDAVEAAGGSRCVYEFGAGNGTLALQLCEHLAHISCRLERYFIIEISSELRMRQQEKLKAFADRITWLDALPAQMQGAVIGNEVLDAMPVKLLQRKQGVWHERGVVRGHNGLTWEDRLTELRPPCEIAGNHDYLTEIHPQPEAFMRTLAEHLSLGVAVFIDYGFPEAEYYHPQRHMGTLMTHHLHTSSTDPLVRIGEQDITAHVNFTACALAAQDAGLEVMGYCTQGRFLLNCGLLSKAERLAQIPRASVAKLINEHEMGELFKVLAVGKGLDLEILGFTLGDRSHTL